MQREGPVIGQADPSREARLNAIVERMEQSGFYSPEDVEAAQQYGEALQKGEQEYVDRWGPTTT